LLLLLLSGCVRQQRRIAAVPDEPYRLDVEDVVDVSVWHDEGISRVLPVRPDGFISLPMAGEIHAAGKTAKELEADVQDHLKPFLNEPRVTVIVREVNSKRVYVTGEVNHPGAFTLRGRVSILQVLALSGGFTDFADRSNIVVFRAHGKAETLRVSYDDLIDADSDNRGDFLLMPGDTVVVH
jgi:polysaccharide export outer membrane protein